MYAVAVLCCPCWRAYITYQDILIDCIKINQSVKYVRCSRALLLVLVLCCFVGVLEFTGASPPVKSMDFSKCINQTFKKECNHRRSIMTASRLAKALRLLPL